MLNGAKKSKEFLITVKEIMNKPNQEMKKEIYFPKGAQSINVDMLNGVITAIYEEEKPALKVGVWYIGTFIPVLYLGNSKGVYLDGGDVHMTKPEHWNKADMQKVKKLLIKEAEKYRANKIKCIRGQIGTTGIIDFDTEFILKKDELSAQNLNCAYTVFDFKTGKWAEIVENKPLKYVIKLTETTKAFPKETFYKCEIGSMLNDTKNKSEAFIFEHFEGAETVKDFIEESYDFKAEIIDCK